MTTPADLLSVWIGRRAAPEAVAWFNSKRAELAREPGARAFGAAFGTVVRRMGKGDLALGAADLAAAEAVRPGWQPSGLTVDKAARIVLLLDVARVGSLADRLKSIAATGDLDELIAIYKGLPLYPDAEALVPLATNGLRTAMRVVFEAVAHHNPFPAEYFSQSAWNHMVLKALFIDSTLYPITGLDRRWNEELAKILVDYAHERWAAHRPVTPELWRGVGRFADAAAIADLARVLADGDASEQKAAVLALSDSHDSAAAQTLASRRDLADAVAAGRITWEDVCEQAPPAYADQTAGSIEPPAGAMFIDPHCHMIARTTDDYTAMAAAGIVAVIEPAFWLGQPRTNVGSYTDYLSHIIGFERFRAGQFGIRHYCTVGLNSKEANNEALAEAVMEILPAFAGKEGVIAIGEIGYDDQTALEDKYFRAQIELAKDYDLPIMIHTPHRDKKRGTVRTMDVLIEHKFDPSRCVIDHNNEETVRDVLDRGFWAAFSIYPGTKMGNARMTELVRQYGPDRIIVDSACDWGASDPLAVPKTARMMVERGIPGEAIRKVTYENALAVYGLNGEMKASDWLEPVPIDQRTLYAGNSVLRGGQTPVITEPRRAGSALEIA
jgi:uncharacterized protein